MESDNTEVISAISKDKQQDNYFGLLITNCSVLLHSFISSQLSHVKKDGNKVAHELVQLALTNANSMWMEDALDNICSLAFLDIF